MKPILIPVYPNSVLCTHSCNEKRSELLFLESSKKVFLDSFYLSYTKNVNFIQYLDKKIHFWVGVQKKEKSWKKILHRSRRTFTSSDRQTHALSYFIHLVWRCYCKLQTELFGKRCGLGTKKWNIYLRVRPLCFRSCLIFFTIIFVSNFLMS